jgi:hypothetical protein
MTQISINLNSKVRATTGSLGADVVFNFTFVFASHKLTIKKGPEN